MPRSSIEKYRGRKKASPGGAREKKGVSTSGKLGKKKAGLNMERGESKKKDVERKKKEE